MYFYSLFVKEFIKEFVHNLHTKKHCTQKLFQFFEKLTSVAFWLKKISDRTFSAIKKNQNFKKV